ncbi:bifunctional DNA-formamidopyrimidine glycosylase/DNA-(apurinic or apyrimidinic site) lyase [Alicyclobacillus tolerans]|uniref:bifunctional DNA-formamidopyrimidine glycosylase/DNA-(apurinic or apyrimidinic site) lyase n=1 Tax=Alicyclobacillus tolerans TaxID=90970 RepID=UPI001EFFE801|nr:bifunctional DNA-formamidopyrimidine glycosylase/DNA-(apurinic or apyrimidinic site) lyase [Alicyclobacillus tolerans]MCF8566214.1 bifunctional DNA-formamidopyrimidine glycosylase/DNA-(apurinic or apyrimidinic site) lyase [Alicyclobacillus tolerans]
MPELPEVENVRRSLEALVVGRTIAQVEVRLPRIVRTPGDTRRFEAELAGATIQRVDRRGKYLLFSMPPLTLVSHLRMEGQYRLVEQTEPVEPHTHVFFRFTDGTELRYRDVRQFGTMDLVSQAGPWPEGLEKLGPEPFDPDLNEQTLYARIHSRTAPIKAVLLDQTCLAGLGNIYVDEALYEAGIHPETHANRITRVKVKLLLAAIRDILQRAIDAGGSSVKSYVNGYGRHGGFQIELNVYSRDGEACRRCGTPIEKLKVAGRGTHVCPHCQKRERTRRRGA